MTPRQIKKARRRIGWSADRLAKEMGVAGSRQVYAWERGEKRLTKMAENLLRRIIAENI